MPHSVVRYHALFDGNERLGLAAVIAFYGLNGWRLTMTNGDTYDFARAIPAPSVMSRSSRRGLEAGTQRS